MAEFPTYEQMAKNVADKALDEFLYDGKSIREWMKIIVEQESKTGHWITGKWSDDAIRYNDTEYKCSLCHHRSDFTSHFCPNCGCRMESEGMI